MHFALRSLLQESQNNLKIFKVRLHDANCRPLLLLLLSSLCPPSLAGFGRQLDVAFRWPSNFPNWKMGQAVKYFTFYWRNSVLEMYLSDILKYILEIMSLIGKLRGGGEICRAKTKKNSSCHLVENRHIWVCAFEWPVPKIDGSN